MNERWKAVAVYRTESGDVDVEHFIEELDDLDQLIESGPHWDTLVKITITINRPSIGRISIEDARKM